MHAWCARSRPTDDWLTPDDLQTKEERGKGGKSVNVELGRQAGTDRNGQAQGQAQAQAQSGTRTPYALPCQG